MAIDQTYSPLIDVPATVSARRLQLFLVVALGIVVGSTAAIDPLLATRWPVPLFDLPLHVLFPGICCVMLALGCLGVCLIAANGHAIFQHRDAIAVVVLLAAASASGVGLGSRDPTDIAVVLVVLYWLFASLVEHRPFRTPLPVTFLLMVLVVLVIASAINGRFHSILRFPGMFAKFCTVLLITNLIDTARAHQLALRALVVIGIISALMAVSSELLYLLGGYELTCEQSLSFRFKMTAFGKMLRATALLPTAQSLAHLLILCSSVVCLAPMSRTRRSLYLSILLAGVIVTFSAGALAVQVVVLVVAMFVARPNRSFQYSYSLFIVATAGYLTGVWQWLYANTVRMAGASGSDRIDLARAGFVSMGEHPFLGVGFGNYRRVMNAPIHNVYLQMPLEIGIAGGLVLVALLLYLALANGIILTGQRSNESAPWLMAILLGLGGLSLQWMVEPFVDNVVSWMFLGLSASAIVVYARREFAVGVAK